MTEIVVSLITGGLALVGVIITNKKSKNDIQTDIKVSQAITDTKLDNLAEEVKKHNNFGMRIPVIEEQIKVINHRIDDLENTFSH